MKKILFVRPDYHSSFIMAQELNKRGIKSKIFVGFNYPKNLLYGDLNTISSIRFKKKNKINTFVSIIFDFLLFLSCIIRYDVFIYYGITPQFYYEDLFAKFLNNFSTEFFLIRTFGKKIIIRPTGCLEEFLKSDFKKIDSNVCNNCGFFNQCNSEENLRKFRLVNKYSNLNIGFGFFNTQYYKSKQIKYKSIDLSEWKPGITIPIKFKLNKRKNTFYVLHSSYINQSGRGNYKNKDIKGSIYISEAITKLKLEGYKIELIFIENQESKNMKYYQSQADLVIDQLIYGHFGSSSIESMALGKPVVCYLNPKWKDFFFKCFPEYNKFPIIEADTENIYSTIKKCLEGEIDLIQTGKNSRIFAKKHFNPVVNSNILLEEINNL